MKKIPEILFSILAFLLIMTPVGNKLQEIAGIPAPVTVGLVAFGFVVKAMQYKPIQKAIMPYMCAVQVEMWSKWIADNLYKDNSFLQYAWNADEYVLAGKVVHIPQSGAASAVVKNRSSLPATVTKRSDTDVTYAIDEYTTDPRVVTNAEEVESSYDKMSSVMADDMGALNETIGDNMLINWAPATNIVRTTGKNGSATPEQVAPYLPSQTGNRLAATHEDVLSVMTAMNSQKGVAQIDRYGVLTAQMYSQVIKSLSATQYTDFSKAYDEANGILGKLHSFKIMMRTTVLIYNNAGTPVVKAYGAAGAATDNDASLFWQKDAVERAKGEIKTFERPDDPQYYGDVVSHLVRMGGRIRRSDEKGIVVLVQGVPA